MKIDSVLVFRSFAFLAMNRSVLTSTIGVCRSCKDWSSLINTYFSPTNSIVENLDKYFCGLKIEAPTIFPFDCNVTCSNNTDILLKDLLSKLFLSIYKPEPL